MVWPKSNTIKRYKQMPPGRHGLFTLLVIFLSALTVPSSAEMVDYQDPVTITREFAALVKLWHVMDGIFIWEFFTTLYYEWDVIRGHRPYIWSIWLYSIARVSTLFSVILNMVGFDATTPINCQVWVTFEVFFAYLSFAASALLIVLFVIGIWKKRNIVIAIAMGIWVTDVAFLINGAVRLRSTWSPEANTCVLINLEATKPNILASLFSDVVLLLIMLAGVLHLRLEAGNDFSFGRILWNRVRRVSFGSWLPPSLRYLRHYFTLQVFMILNLNVPLNLMFQTPCMVATAIAATRIYRSLVDLGSAKMTDSGSGRIVSDMEARPGPVPLSRVEVTMHDPYRTSQRGCGSNITTDPGGPYKAHEMSFDVDGPGK